MTKTWLHRWASSLAIAAAIAGTAPTARADDKMPAQPAGGVYSPEGVQVTPMRIKANEDRAAAAVRAYERKGAPRSMLPASARHSPQLAPPAPKAAPGGQPAAGGGAVKRAAAALLELTLAQTGPPDLFGFPNFANSKLPIATCSVSGAQCVADSDCPQYAPPFAVGVNMYPGGETCTGPVVSGGIRKFVDQLATFCDSTKANNGKNGIGQCLPLAVPDKTTYGDADYYEIAVKQYTAQFHSDLPATTQVRGYYQKNGTGEANKAHYLGPIIVAKSGRPVRVRFVNELATGAAGKLFIPVDPTVAGAGTGPDGTLYSENRATLHLHGGNTPWISDGTQHQWTAPKGEPTSFKKGLTTANVPDMWFDASGNTIAACGGLTVCPVAGARNDPGDGAMTFYWTNQQSGRFMFFHDHAYGITRLNVYAGEAAGYLLVNPPDEDALAAATVPGTIGSSGATTDLAHMVPLVIQDKSFVPPAAQLAAQDPSWDTTAWGGEGNFWYPHVYTPNQWPGNPDNSGTNPFGRWDYGPWFWPPQTSLVSDGVNRPLTQPCATTATPSGWTDCPTIPNVSAVPESFMDTMIVNGTAYPTLTVDPVAYRFQVLNASNERNINLSFFKADSTGTEVPMVDAIPHSPTSALPLCSPTAAVNPATGLPSGCWPIKWPTDARFGGVPDPAAAGPAIVQIGSEGGILPAPAVIPAQPVDYEYNRRNIVVLNVSSKALFIGPAERADIVVDFTAFAGQTLILYNDAPAPVPAADPRLDYFTGDQDQTLSGGAPTTHPGYGPNTRTIMQVKVRGTPTLAGGRPLNTGAAAQALAARFAISQPAPIVPAAAFNPVYGTTTLADTYIPIQGRALTFTPVCAQTNPPTCADPNAPQTVQFAWKAIQELFDLDYGRMNALLGVEVPMTSFLNQTTIPYFNFDPATEFLADDKPQIWKITHNGVDTHTIHFHLFNAQVVNRVGWDGQVRPPDANELGWKESVRMHPLEDIYVALRPVRQNLPWPLPDMWRPMDVTKPLGSTTQFTAVDINNLPITVQNQVVNYGWEYVWHCHLLGHEEGDMLRAEVFVVAPEVPSNLTVTDVNVPVGLRWNDTSKSALSFSIERSTTATFDPGTVDTITMASPGIGPGLVTTADGAARWGRTYFYRVRAEKVLTTPAIPGVSYPAYSGWSNVVSAVTPPPLRLSPSPIAFGNVYVGHPVTIPVTATNVGASPFTITGVGFSGANQADFTQTNNCGTIPAGGTCTINVTFGPGAGPRVATLVTQNAFAPVTADITGFGLQPIGAVSPTSLTFNPEVVNSTTPAQIVTLTNTGNAALLISSISFTGTNRTDFAQTNTCGGSVAPAGSCTISVMSKPTGAGTRTATLAIATNDAANPTLTVALTGTSYTNLVPATGVTLTGSVASPSITGTAVTFTAQGQGSPFPYLYRFWLYTTATSRTLVQDYSALNQWTLPASTQPGSYYVQVDVRTSPAVSRDAFTGMSYSVRLPPPTSLILSAQYQSPHLGPVQFTATAYGSSGYEYRFWLYTSAGRTLVQDYSPISSWTLPVGTVLGSYYVQVDVRTSALVTRDLYTGMNYTVR